jgi:hypothetical protein
MTRTVNPERHAGRPRELTAPTRVNLSLSASEYDRLDRIATALGTSVPKVIRRLLRRRLRPLELLGQ